MIKKDNEHQFAAIDADTLAIWKLSPPIPVAEISTKLKDVQSPQQIPGCVKLDGADELSEHFSSAPRNHLHIIVEAPTQNRGMKRRRGELDDLTAEKSRLFKMAKHAPSSLSEPSTFQTAAQDVVACNRPFDWDTIPITLLQEEFGLFMDDRKVLPSPKSQELLQALTVAACKWHENETQRRSEIQKVFNDVAGFYLSAEFIDGTEYKTHGNSTVNIMPAVIRKCNNDAECALREATGFYVQFLVKVLDRRDMGNRFPCILLIDTGSHFGLYGCLWTGEHLHVEPLTPFYDLKTHWTDESGRQAIAGSLNAFLNAVPRLEAHYTRLAFIAPIPLSDISPLDRTYPYKTSYDDENGQHVNFSYRSRVDDKLVFLAEPDKSPDKDLGTLCIKFTRRYSEDAHRFLAQSGYAPRLRAVMRLPGGWNMVVMDYSNYKQLYESMPQMSKEQQYTITAKVIEVVQKLHDAGFVHGDLQSSNVLVDCEMSTSKDDIKIHLIDFDWAGRQGEVVYPMGVNTVTVRRPEGALDGKPILVEHDLIMVNSFPKHKIALLHAYVHTFGNLYR